jgi:outer membrane lipoprotein SlyB
MRKILCLLGLVFSLVIAGCAKDIPPGDYDAAEAGKVKKVAPGVVISMRAVKFHSKATETSAASNPGTDYVDGGRGYEYVIKLNSGEIVSVAQAEDMKLKANQHVLVIYGSTTRVMPDEGSNG